MLVLAVKCIVYSFLFGVVIGSVRISRDPISKIYGDFAFTDNNGSNVDHSVLNTYEKIIQIHGKVLSLDILIRE